MDYPLHQYRLFTRYATSLVDLVSSVNLGNLWLSNLPKLYDETNKTNDLLHALSSVCKAQSTWNAHEILFEARRAMGGLGYSHHALIGPIVYNGDVNQTFEGDNNVLIMQTAKFLMKATADTPTCGFLSQETVTVGDTVD